MNTSPVSDVLFQSVQAVIWPFPINCSVGTSEECRLVLSRRKIVPTDMFTGYV
jgi:hypothetical protein